MKKKILLVDDDLLVLKTVTNLLQSKGYEVSACKTGAEAVNAFKNQRFDLVITDVRMPGQDGVRTIKLIRENEKASGSLRTPVVMITGYASEDIPVEAIELGVDGYVLKPFDYDRFLSTIEKSMEKASGYLPTAGSDIEKICSEVKKIISDFHDANEREIFENKKLKELLGKIENCLTRLERALIKLV